MMQTSIQNTAEKNSLLSTLHLCHIFSRNSMRQLLEQIWNCITTKHQILWSSLINHCSRSEKKYFRVLEGHNLTISNRCFSYLTMEPLKYESGAHKQLEYQTIDEFFRNKAEKELGETNVKRNECLSALRKLAESEQDLITCTSDDFLLQFLRARKFNVQRAFDLLKKYYHHKLDHPSLHNRRPYSHNLKYPQENFMSFLPLRTPEGCAIWAVRLGLWDPEELTIENVMSFGYLCHEHAMKNPLTQISGVVTILDLKGMSLSHLFHISPKSVLAFTRATHDCYPVRYKAIHVLNHPSICNFLYSIMKPLISTKIRNRIHFHKDEKNICKILPVDILPEAFGGTLKTFGNKPFINSMFNSL